MCVGSAPVLEGRHVMPTHEDSPGDLQRRNRLDLCRASQAMEKAILRIHTSDCARRELLNLNRANLRMALALNDGNLSPFELRTW